MSRSQQPPSSGVGDKDPRPRVFSGRPDPEDLSLDHLLRPHRFQDFPGQELVKRNLRIYIEAAKKRGEPLDHLLFSGPPGLGKTTLAMIVTEEMGAAFKCTSGPVLERPGDLAGILTNLEEGNVLFIDEIHRLSPVIEEYLYGAMEDFVIDIVLDQGPSARSMRISLPRFTLVGATTREGLLTPPFRARFGVREKLDFYAVEDLLQIAMNSASKLEVEIEDAGARLIAGRARGTPRVVNRFLRRVRDLAEVRGRGVISEAIAREGLEMLGVDEHGLDTMDRKIIEAVLRAGGRPVGLKTIALIVGEEEDTVEEVYEPYLIRNGYLEKTPRGRLATEQAFERYRGDRPGQKGLFGK